MNKKVFFFILLSVFSLNFAKEVLADPPPWAPAHGYRRKHHHHERDYYEEERPVVVERRVEYYQPKPKRRARVYKYIYYPEQEVYYYPVTRRYYYRKPSGSWSFGLTLPGNISIGASSGRAIELDSDRPYLHHDEVRIKFR